MKKLFALASTVAMLAVFALPVHAANPTPCAPPPPPGTTLAQTYACTMHISDFTPPPMHVTPITCPDGSTVPGGLLTVTVETGVFHLTVNTAGDAWDTSTLEGPFLFVGDDGITVTGHYTEWFGDSFNNKNVVSHFTLNFVGMGSNGSVLSLHLELRFSLSVSGEPFFSAKAHC
jgi:hypothetical protein